MSKWTVLTKRIKNRQAIACLFKRTAQPSWTKWIALPYWR